MSDSDSNSDSDNDSDSDSLSGGGKASSSSKKALSAALPGAEPFARKSSSEEVEPPAMLEEFGKGNAATTAESVGVIDSDPEPSAMTDEIAAKDVEVIDAAGFADEIAAGEAAADNASEVDEAAMKELFNSDVEFENASNKRKRHKKGRDSEKKDKKRRRRSLEDDGAGDDNLSKSQSKAEEVVESQVSAAASASGSSQFAHSAGTFHMGTQLLQMLENPAILAMIAERVRATSVADAETQPALFPALKEQAQPGGAAFSMEARQQEEVQAKMEVPIEAFAAAFLEAQAATNQAQTAPAPSKASSAQTGGDASSLEAQRVEVQAEMAKLPIEASPAASLEAKAATTEAQTAVAPSEASSTQPGGAASSLAPAAAATQTKTAPALSEASSVQPGGAASSLAPAAATQTQMAPALSEASSVQPGGPASSLAQAAATKTQAAPAPSEASSVQPGGGAASSLAQAAATQAQTVTAPSEASSGQPGKDASSLSQTAATEAQTAKAPIEASSAQLGGEASSLEARKVDVQVEASSVQPSGAASSLAQTAAATQAQTAKAPNEATSVQPGSLEAPKVDVQIEASSMQPGGAAPSLAHAAATQTQTAFAQSEASSVQPGLPAASLAPAAAASAQQAQGKTYAGMSVGELAAVVNSSNHRKEYMVLSRMSADQFPTLAAGCAAGGKQMRLALASLILSMQKNGDDGEQAKRAAEAFCKHTVTRKQALDCKGIYIHEDELLEKMKFDKPKAEALMSKLARTPGGTMKCPNLGTQKYWWATEQSTVIGVTVESMQGFSASGEIGSEFGEQLSSSAPSIPGQDFEMTGNSFGGMPQLPAPPQDEETGKSKSKAAKVRSKPKSSGDDDAGAGGAKGANDKDKDTPGPELKVAEPERPEAWVLKWQASAVDLLGVGTATEERLKLVGCQETMCAKLQAM